MVSSQYEFGKISPSSGSTAKMASAKGSGSSSTSRRCMRSVCAGIEPAASSRAMRPSVRRCSSSAAERRAFHENWTFTSLRLCSLSVVCESSEM